jgi:hypothetical protein
MKFSIYGKNMLNIERLAVEDFFRFGEGGDRSLIQLFFMLYLIS